MKLLLANVDYRLHMSDEGDQLQAGLEEAGWILAGEGWGDNCRDVPTLIDRFRPDVVLVHDKRDWDRASGIAFRRDIAFENLGVLARVPSFNVAVVKDAGGWLDYHRQFCEEIGAAAVVIYYHPESVKALSPWLANYPLVRTYHTVDSRQVPTFHVERSGVIVTGARGRCYPLRNLACDIGRSHHWRIVPHPGYGNRGTYTQSYLHALSRHKVHIATASTFDFALRKIIESVACGCTPVTTLSARDRLPEIDDALVRVPHDLNEADLVEVVSEAERGWDPVARETFARAALSFYDFRRECARLNVSLCECRARSMERVCTGDLK